MEETAPRSPNLKTCVDFISNYVYHGIVPYYSSMCIPNQFFLTLYYLFSWSTNNRSLKVYYTLSFLKDWDLQRSTVDTGEGPPPSIFLYKKFILFFFCYFFSGDVLLFQTWILILNVFLNLNNYSIFTLEPRRCLSHLKLSVI